MKIEVLNPHGFCAGVTAALKTAQSILGGGGAWCLHEIVHNELVVAALKAGGMHFTDDLAEIPEGATVVFSAHGVSPAVRREAEGRKLKIVDATCPFVKKVHTAARAFSQKGLPVVVIGKRDHAEVKGLVGEAEKAFIYPELPGSGPFGVVSQTTMNADEVGAITRELAKTREIETMAEVCRATKERQDAVKAFRGDALLVLGSSTSSNTRRLCEVARCRTFRAGTMDEVRAMDFTGVETLGVTSGASTPEDFFNKVTDYLRGKEK